jgi:hypothetical protein
MYIGNCEFAGAARVCKHVASVLEKHAASIFTVEEYFQDTSNEFF